MITNFETITEDLTEIELSYSNDVKMILLGVLNDKPIKQPQLCDAINSNLQFMQADGISVTGVRLRKYVNYFRSKGILPILATSDGYLLTNDKEMISGQIKSLKQRAASILKAANGLEKFL